VIAAIQYTCIGSEVNDGINTEIYFHGASGYKIIDTIVKGRSKNLTMDETTGYVLVDELLVRGDTVVCLYKTLPRNASVVVGGSMVDFTDGDFESNDFT
jgi:hypothetical protein